jgi:signal transduction histidine kinase/ActR/RegA family two-component response regulator
MSHRILTLSISLEQDVVLARQRTRQIAELLNFGVQDQTRLATAISEVARNAFTYAGGGRVDYLLEGETPPQVLIVKISDNGPGIGQLQQVLNGRYVSTTGMGVGLTGAMRLMDQSSVDTGERGTVITLKKLLPPGVPALSGPQVGELGAQLAKGPVATSFDEVQRHNQELLQALEEVRARQEQLIQLTAELEDTNRGVVALYAELDEKAEDLRRADHMKSRFLSNMSHEFRTPLSSIRALSRLLLARVDGDLHPEQEKQVSLILRGAEDLSELVNDLLDLAKIEAGKTDVRAAPVDVANVFSALRGMMRPLLSSKVDLLFVHDEALPVMFSDEGKIAQILRNLISNALKFTERGEVEVSAQVTPDGRAMEFRVRDTGLGIATEHLPLIFEEFTQIENRLQRGVKGTGLGLPLCRKLAELMGGDLKAESTPGVGSVFIATLPLRYAEEDPLHETSSTDRALALDPDRPTVLIVEDDPATRLLYEDYVRGTRYQPVSVATVQDARKMLAMIPVAAVLLEIVPPEEEAWRLLTEIKHGDTDPLLIIATDNLDKGKGIALGADAYLSKPAERHDVLALLARLDRPDPSSPLSASGDSVA